MAKTIKTYKNSLVWMRRDLRLSDHHALSEATKLSEKVFIVFIFDPNTLNNLKDKKDARISFIMDSLFELAPYVEILYGLPKESLIDFTKKNSIEALFFNEDYTPYARRRDLGVKQALESEGIKVLSFKDSVYFSPDQILKKDQTPYRVFTPYSKAWLEQFSFIPCYDVDLKCVHEYTKNYDANLLYEKIGFIPVVPYFKAGRKEGLRRLKAFTKIISEYKQYRDFPQKDHTSHLSVYLRFGVISIREMLSIAQQGSDCWLNELIWREFYQMILYHYPHAQSKCFNSKYDQICWPGKKEHFELWCQGKTGFPIVDAAMRCLNQTGFMHNRLRMVTATFLCKTLLIDWRWGERYFALKLLDYDLASNNGGWQWCASTGCDAQPYFRIFNPYTQAKKFDPDNQFIQSYLSQTELQDPAYREIVDYKVNRQIAIDLFKF